MSHLPIWYIAKLDDDVVEKASRSLSSIPPRDATMGIDGDQTNHSHRNTTVRFATPDHWMHEILCGVAMQGNETCKWDFVVDGNEAIQHAEYGVDQHYNWHTDTFTLSGQPRDRKITVVCLLSDPSEFTGGEFQIRLYQEYTAPLQKGSAIAFPSMLEHRVTPVLSGLRSTATVWLTGPRMR